jgi:Mg-chelatase subunit ChlD
MLNNINYNPFSGNSVPQIMKTYVAMILDKSSSMESCKKPTVDGYNEKLDVLRKIDHDVFMTLTVFNEKAEVVYQNRSIKEVNNLSHSEYQPNGSTALFDAVDLTLDVLEKIALGPKDAVLVVVLSDGEENSSKPESRSRVPERIARLTNTGQYTFNYIGSNQDLATISKNLNIPISNMSSYHSTPQGTANALIKSSSDMGKYFESRTRGITSSSSYANDKNEVAQVEP